MEIIELKTSGKCEMVDITKRIKEAVNKNKWNDGILVVFSMHTTGGITINESYDPDVQHDLIRALDKMVPDLNFRHMEGNSDAYLKTSLIGAESTLIVEKGELLLGTWQGVYFCEFDGGRERRVLLKFIGK
ncbi:secondary thiamine-phosphate synthase enzyme YjbQ [uncultured Ilyobacter sp.]|uniref:secondary thiamine-phosphate synthase enzyme YjbQ n=1 Tax=uncultured Ilyobacter sp. TaxID=544433 RepID=UPI002AA84A54|nr:secondary thiamine-phosphate synthase enzyme YjbQ [uncultured Ilyobacter sp.]